MEFREVLKSLKVVPIGKVSLHDEPKAEQVAALKAAMRSAKYFTNPIIVDRRTFLVLDGTQRVKALEELGYRNVVCQLVDYRASEIQVKTWYPVLRCANIPELLSAVASKKTTFKQGLREVERMKAAFMLAFDRGRGKECFLIEPSAKPMKPAELFAAQKHALSKFAHRHELHYIPEEEHEKFIHTSSAVVLYKRTFSKEEVLKLSVEGGLLFPPKTTRHIIPLRVLGLDVPMSWLNLPEAEAQEKLDFEVRRRAEAGWIRFYAEPVLVLNDYRFE